MRDLINIVNGKTAPGTAKTRLDEMPTRPRGRLPGRDLRPDDTSARIDQAYGNLRRYLDGEEQNGPRVIDGEFADMDRPVIAPPPRAIPAPAAAFDGDDDFEIATPPAARAPSRAVAPRTIDADGLDDGPTPGTALAPVAPRGGSVATSADYEPRWMKVGDMPPMMRFAIQAQGAPLFSQFTDTPVTDIRILSGMTHSAHEVRALEDNIRAEGTFEGEMDIHAHGLTSRVERFNWHGWDTLITKDPGGTHVFAWPEGRRLGAPARGRGLPPPAPPAGPPRRLR